MGRLGIICNAAEYMRLMIPIAVRYAAYRRQFGREDGKELPLLEYPLHQVRLLPYLSATIVLTHVAYRLNREYTNYVIRTTVEKSDELDQMNREIHAISCSGKAYATWLSMQCVQECREACGGHGYLKASRLGDLRSDLDPTVTYEGDNNVLLQQTANYLLSCFKLSYSHERFSSPLKTINFISKSKDLLTMNRSRIFEQACHEIILNAYRFLCCYLLEKLIRISDKNVAMGQVFVHKCLSLAFFELMMLDWYSQHIVEASQPNLRPTLSKIRDLFAVWSIQKHLSTLYMAGFCSGSSFGDFLQTNVLRLCSEMKNDAVALADAIAAPDHIIDSVLGRSDGRIYDAIFASFLPPDHPNKDRKISSKL